MDVIIREASLRDVDGTVDIGITNNYIENIRPNIGQTASTEIDAAGGLVLPNFVDPHTHLDKAFFTELADPPERGTLPELIELTGEIKKNLDESAVRERIERAARDAVANGTTTIRTHLDIGDVWEQTSVRAAMDVKESLAEIVDIQTTAVPLVRSSPEKGLTGTDIERLERALERGVDAIGGEPNKEDTDQLEKDAIDVYFDLAATYDADIDLHVDGLNSPTARTAEYIAHKTIEKGMEGQVLISHVSALSYYDKWHRRDVIDLFERADLDIITTPKEDQIVADHDTTAVSELLEADVNLSIGHNNIAGTISPYGSLDMLGPAWLLAHVAEMRTPTDANTLIDTVTHNPAAALGLEQYGIETGSAANLTVCVEETPLELLRTRLPRRAVLKDGSLVASSSLSTAVGVNATHTV